MYQRVVGQYQISQQCKTCFYSTTSIFGTTPPIPLPVLHSSVFFEISLEAAANINLGPQGVSPPHPSAPHLLHIRPLVFSGKNSGQRFAIWDSLGCPRSLTQEDLDSLRLTPSLSPPSLPAPHHQTLAVSQSIVSL